MLSCTGRYSTDGNVTVQSSGREVVRLSSSSEDRFSTLTSSSEPRIGGSAAVRRLVEGTGNNVGRGGKRVEGAGDDPNERLVEGAGNRLDTVEGARVVVIKVEGTLDRVEGAGGKVGSVGKRGENS